MTCSVVGCNQLIKYKGMCGLHYKRQWRHGNASITHTPERGFERLKCTAEDCNRVSERANGLCIMHDQRLRRYGRLNNFRNDNGVGGLNLDGYWVVTIEGVRQYEHILIAEKALGKPLPRGAIVHHINNKPWDNRPENLVICPSQAYHTDLHHRMDQLGISFDG